MSLNKYLDQLEQKTRKTTRLRKLAENLMPGGVAGNAGLVANKSLYIDKAVGGRITDVDGNEYLDLILSGTADILGHSPREIVDAVKRQLDKGTSYMLFHETGIEVVRKIQKHVPHLQRIRFANSGTEATMFAIRAARSWTKKEKIAKSEGGYHGQHDYVLMSFGKSAGPANKPEANPASAGIPKFIPENTIIFPWNDIDATCSIIEENADQLAAVILEPVQGFGLGAIPAEKNYLEAVREITKQHNIVLIFDEVISGFRIGGLGGAASYFGIAPDLACYGKSIAGGFPIGLFGGQKDIMEKTINPDASPEYKIFQSGTFTGNVVSMTAALACLTELEKKDYAYIDGLAEKLKSGVSQLASAKGFSMQFTGVGSFFYPHFNENPIRNMRDREKDDAALNAMFCMGLIVNGVFFTPGHAGATCFAHTDSEIEFVLEVAEKILNEMKST